ncbi:hypothetical protein [uncultured Litoreibacter sp.]|uniref:hypothetical protein n=1 Tax=uncultured Litoreibacter sp. TaxID=1392394 RepID=UPI0026353D43|nr:hypothetical protein [uncultured Litoreibacter sp.]
MPKSSKKTRSGGTKKAVQHSAKPGFDAAQLKVGKGGGKSQQAYGGKPPRFPGRTGGR